MDNLFLRATREKFRFPSTKGDLNIEQVWDLPLQSAKGDSLDTVAKTINAQLKNVSEESFVSVASNPQRGVLQAKLDVVKDIITFRIAENEKRKAAAQRANDKQFLLDLLERKRADQMGELSVEEIERRLRDLDA